jgi:tryptophan synthase beta chain
MSDQVKFVLDESRMPEAWYNVVSDLPEPPPPVLHPGTGEPVGPDDLAPLFPMQIILQEVATDQYVAIPEEIRSVYRQWRPTPLFRARRLEQSLETPARIYYKYEGVSPTGSHKPNTAVAQAYYNKREGVSRLTTETGAGQWGSALAFAGGIFGLEVDVYMVRVSYEQKPYRRGLIEAFGARCVPSPSRETNAGQAILAEHPDSTGSLGIAISEAVEAAATREDTKYALGSVLNHVLMHQTVIGQEAQLQLDDADDYPDVVIGCTGGGSNFSGLSFPFIGKALREGKELRVIAVEPTACPSLTKGRYAFDFGDTGHLTPLVKMHTLGSTFVPPPFHAGGLRYHGMAPLVSHLQELGLIESRAYTQTEVFAAGVEFARVEGILPAPEANHAVKATIDEAVRCREEGVSEAILFNLCGHGHFDMQAYIDYFAGKLEDHEYSEDEVAMRSPGSPRSRSSSPGAHLLARVREPFGDDRLGGRGGSGSGDRGEEARCVDRIGVDMRIRDHGRRPRHAPQKRDLADSLASSTRPKRLPVVGDADPAVRDEEVVISRLSLVHDDVARFEGAWREALGKPVERRQRERGE